jgi:hypothetical protein
MELDHQKVVELSGLDAESSMEKLIIIAQDFAVMPGGRKIQDGPFSGELFRKSILEPALRNDGTIVIDLDGVRGYGSSFLEEAFGGLVRDGFEKRELRERLEIRAWDSSLQLEILDYIDKAHPVALSAA